MRAHTLTLVSILDIFYEGAFLFFIMSNINDISKSGVQECGTEVAQRELRGKVESARGGRLFRIMYVELRGGDASKKESEQQLFTIYFSQFMRH